jgi:hypothetical protein
MLSFAALLAGVVAMPGGAASFVDYTPCPADGPFLVCPSGQVGQPYNLQLLAHSGCDIYRWEITNGSLPAGLSMNSDGKITGVPNGATEVRPWVTVHDLTAGEGGYPWCGGDNQSQRQFIFTVVPGLSIVDNSVPGATIGQPYSKQLSVESLTSVNPRTASPATATWRVQSGNLPTGVTLSSSGLLSGTPNTEASYTFVVRAEVGGGVFDTETYNITVRQPMDIAARAPKAEVGMPFTVTPTATAGSGTYAWSISKGALPAGLGPIAENGAISGTPTVAGRFPFTITATDSEGRVKNVDIVLVVAQKLAILTTKLPTAKVGKTYRARLVKLGGVAPVAWTITGKLPKGVKFAPRLGLLLGKPTKAGKARLTLAATDQLGATVKKTFTLVVTG